MNQDYRMSHNVCSVELHDGSKVFIRLFLLKGESPKWFFNVTSEDGEHCFTSSMYSDSTLAINGILDFINVVHGLFFIGKPTSPFGCLLELFSDVIYK